MSPVLFALALDPFLELLSRRLPKESMVRAYADDMALILSDLGQLSVVAPLYQLLAKASCLHVNISKTVLVPLYEAGIVQARKDISFSAWARVKIEVGCSKYLGIFVGPQADSDINFAGPMIKFRERAAYWLGCPWLGAYFQSIGFNMFALSVLQFVGQLYPPSTTVENEIMMWAGKFAHGPNNWLWGDGGHAFFRASVELGLRASPRCPKSVCKSSLLRCSLRFMPKFQVKLKELDTAILRSHIPYTKCLDVIQKSVHWHSKSIQEEATKLRFDSVMFNAPIKADANKLMYNMFFDSIHPKGVVEHLLAHHYSSRWFAGTSFKTASGVLVPIADVALEMGNKGCKHLHFVGTCVPSRVHLANVRFHFNGWHTKARYQKRSGSTCLFCQLEESEDSIEHIICCPVIQDLLPRCYKKGSPPRVPVKYFYLFGLDNKHKLAMALYVFAVYTMHNDLRHNPNRTELRQCISRIAGEVRLTGSLRNVWEEVFGWRLNP